MTELDRVIKEAEIFNGGCQIKLGWLESQGNQNQNVVAAICADLVLCNLALLSAIKELRKEQSNDRV